MRGFLIAAAVAASTIIFSQTASAAPPPAPRWAGWYAGMNAGGNWGGDPVSTTASNSQFCSTCGSALATANASIQGATGEFPAEAGFIAGGQFGYNWQLTNRWVAGFEADIQGLLTDAGGSNSRYSTAAVSGFAGHSVGTDLSATKRIDFLGTVRGRLGYLVVPRLLVFGTGGFAYGHVKSSTSISQNLIGTFGGVATSFDTDLSVSKMLGGWTLGGGFEWMFARNWTAKVEYLYYDLGTVTSNGQIADRITVPAPPTTYYFANDVQSTTRFNGNIVRVGLNYHF